MMMVVENAVKVVVLDIEGTVCPISFVKDVLFPYALDVLPSTLATQWNSPAFEPYLSAFPSEHRASPAALTTHVQSLMSQDLKLPALKSLQGYLWQSGYETGALRCPLFVDVAPCVRTWRASGIRIVIYSSGSVAAQKLLFQHTNADPEQDLRGLIEAYFDTVNAGPKTQVESYRWIVHGIGDVKERDCLFLSDNTAEVEAAREAGLRARLVVRKGNMPVNVEVKEKLGALTSFEELKITR